MDCKTVLQSTNFDPSIGESRELSAHELEVNDVSRGFDVSNGWISARDHSSTLEQEIYKSSRPKNGSSTTNREVGVIG